MKVNITLLFLLLLACTSIAQTIRRVNNNPGVTGTNIYSTIQAAHDAASNGDIIYVEPSGTAYGNLEMTKQLTIYGNGYFHDKNLGLQADSRPSRIGAINIYPGASGSIIEGLSWDGGEGSNNIYGANSVTIARNRISYLRVTTAIAFLSGTHTSITSLIIRGNFFTGGSALGLSAQAPATISNTLITNNFLRNTSSPFYPIILDGEQVINTIFQNNIVVAEYLRLRNMTVSNNIFLVANEGTFVTSSGSCCANLANNVSFFNNAGKLLPSGNGNNNTIEVRDEFVQVVPAPPYNSITFEDAKLQLKVTSPLKIAGTGASEVGIFGGATPYTISGISTIPNILKFNVTPSGSSTTPLSVTISTKSNN